MERDEVTTISYEQAQGMRYGTEEILDQLSPLQEALSVLGMTAAAEKVRSAHDTANSLYATMTMLMSNAGRWSSIGLDLQSEEKLAEIQRSLGYRYKDPQATQDVAFLMGLMVKIRRQPEPEERDG